MSYEQKPNRGVAYVNNYKKDHNHPDMKGQFFADRSLLKKLLEKTDGDLVEIAISVWDGVSAKGNRYLSLQVGEPFKKPEESKIESKPEDDEDVPF